MSGKKRFQKPGSLQPNIDDILEWSKLPEDAFDPASSQEKADFIKDRKSVSYWADAWRRLRSLGYFRICGTERGSLYL